MCGFYVDCAKELHTSYRLYCCFIGSRYSTCTFAKKSLKKSKREVPEAFEDLSDDKFVQDDKLDTSINTSAQYANNSIPSSPRSAVLQACIVTSGLIAALGTVIRQVIFLLSNC